MEIWMCCYLWRTLSIKNKEPRTPDKLDCTGLFLFVELLALLFFDFFLVLKILRKSGENLRAAASYHSRGRAFLIKIGDICGSVINDTWAESFDGCTNLHVICESLCSVFFTLNDDEF